MHNPMKSMKAHQQSCTGKVKLTPSAANTTRHLRQVPWHIGHIHSITLPRLDGGLGLCALLRELITKPLERPEGMVTAHPSKEETIVDCEEWYQGRGTKVSR